jgi:HEAT repeats
VPNAAVAARLDSLTTAMAGGLFFTLSIGAGLSLATLIGAWLWARVFRRRRRATLCFSLVWIAVLLLANGNGWNPAASGYILVVPLVTAITAIRLMPARSSLDSPAGIIWPAAAVVILALLWSLVLGKNLFINIRDFLLLPNPIGRSITDAYYRYTLFPAEAFKSLQQKQIRTCVIDGSLAGADRERIEAVLRAHDYLPLGTGRSADLTVGWSAAQKRFLLEHHRRIMLTVSRREMLSRSGTVLKAYSDRCDRNRIFRLLTLIGLLLGFPLVLFSFIFSGLRLSISLFLPVASANLITALLCIALGALLLAPVYRGQRNAVASADLAGALSASSLFTRIAALRQTCDKHRDIAVAAQRMGLVNSPHIAVRYWLARSLACAKAPPAPAMLQALAGDSAIIVACQALWALGERGDPAAVQKIIARIDASPHWYIQMYAYRALRTLGWIQPRSPQISY